MFIPTLKVGHIKESQLALSLDMAPRAKVVRFVAPVKTTPTPADHFLNCLFRLISFHTVKREAVTRGWNI